ncbi:NAD(P)H-dependent oxidoreductase [Bacillus sp. ISL-18]|uniref:FMN-dependent NADH-azoreductase n=1 Tax=Bacillus sp. ISL-18 TaxID=2819118 RepID=UPI001BED0051|nr:NAD(P)H-dependent oxidoreductase [Bacillus sp. ISL-18]MBT2653681.1 NAD(P)H-dependent oxidoreductase [Bacillus sp. ISL-18]
MKKLLYVTANPKGLEKSKGLKIGEAFLEALHEERPDIEINRIDLFAYDFPQMDADLVSARGKLAGYGFTLDQLTVPEREKITKMHALADEFITFDYYVFVSPMWNLNSPAVLKAYIDNLFISGKTFAHTANGPKGLLTNKKAIHIQTRGGQYTGTPMEELESGDRYLKIALRFLGMEVSESVIAEGFDLNPQKVPELLKQGKVHARMAAREFVRELVQA